MRASGRDTGDSMKLSRDKITDISHKLVVAMRKARNIRLEEGPERHPACRSSAISPTFCRRKTRLIARRGPRSRSQKREIAEGTEEFDLLHKRYYAEELKKLGIDLTR